jgi:hypothetical protein
LTKITHILRIITIILGTITSNIIPIMVLSLEVVTNPKTHKAKIKIAYIMVKIKTMPR